MSGGAAAVLAVVGGAASACLAQTAQVWTDAAHTNPVVMNFSLSWREYNPVTLQPVPHSNGVLDPGEGAGITLAVSTTPLSSGTDPGTQVFWNPAVVGGHGSGTLWGVCGLFFDVVGVDTSGSAGANGSWWLISAGVTTWGVPGRWAVGDQSTMGTPVNSGSQVANIQAGQFGANLLQLGTNDPVPLIWRGLWTPASYSPRMVTFSVANNSAGVPDASVLLADSTFPQNTIPLAAFTGVNFGSVGIPVGIPAPSGLAIVALGGALGTRRRRRLGDQS